jgi:hypothetical protein
LVVQEKGGETREEPNGDLRARSDFFNFGFGWMNQLVKWVLLLRIFAVKVAGGVE